MTSFPRPEASDALTAPPARPDARRRPRGGGQRPGGDHDLPQFTPSPFTKARGGRATRCRRPSSGSPCSWDPTSPTDKQDVVTDPLAGGSPHLLGPAPPPRRCPLFLSTAPVLGQRRRLPGDRDLQRGGRTWTVTRQTPASTRRRRAARSRSTTARWRPTTGTSRSTWRRPTRSSAASPGTSSGVTQSATDVDGNGTFPCDFIFAPRTPDFSGCAVAFKPATPATLTAGDGVKTVGVKFGDGARVNTAPCPPALLRHPARQPDPRQRVGGGDGHDPARHGEADRGREAGPHDRQSRGPGELRRRLRRPTRPPWPPPASICRPRCGSGRTAPRTRPARRCRTSSTRPAPSSASCA